MKWEERGREEMEGKKKGYSLVIFLKMKAHGVFTLKMLRIEVLY